jgi:hypothetical protein
VQRPKTHEIYDVAVGHARRKKKNKNSTRTHIWEPGSLIRPSIQVITVTTSFIYTSPILAFADRHTCVPYVCSRRSDQRTSCVFRSRCLLPRADAKCERSRRSRCSGALPFAPFFEVVLKWFIMMGTWSVGAVHAVPGSVPLEQAAEIIFDRQSSVMTKWWRDSRRRRGSVLSCSGLWFLVAGIYV